MNGDKRFGDKIQAFSNKHGIIAVCGTCHQLQDMHNKALVFFPDDTESPRENLKFTSANSINVGEVVRTPRNDHLPVYKTRYEENAILIFMDAYDINMLFRQIYKRMMSDKK